MLERLRFISGTSCKKCTYTYTYVHTDMAFQWPITSSMVPKLDISLIKLSIFTVFLIIFLTVNPCPPCQPSLQEETGELG